MIILEDDLEKLMVANEPTELTYEGYQEISERLNQLQPHMQASSGCWEETVHQVDHMLRRANAASGGLRGTVNKQCVSGTSIHSILVSICAQILFLAQASSTYGGSFLLQKMGQETESVNTGRV